MGHDHGGGTSAEVWDEMYRSRPKAWSGRPNPQLVAEAAELPAGTALDLGCGEGADAIWLAARGWTVTAVDVSAVALERAAAAAAQRINDDGSAGRSERGLSEQGHIEWVQADLAAWTPEHTFDLVSAQFLHSTVVPWQDALRNAPSAVRPGGTLLIVGHHPDGLPPWGSHASKDKFYGPEELARALGIEGPAWDVKVLERRDRRMTGPDGKEAAVGDTVLKATRL